MSRRRTLLVLSTVAAMALTLGAAPRTAPPPRLGAAAAASVDYASVVDTLRREIPQMMADTGVVGDRKSTR